MRGLFSLFKNKKVVRVTQCPDSSLIIPFILANGELPEEGCSSFLEHAKKCNFCAELLKIALEPHGKELVSWEGDFFLIPKGKGSSYLSPEPVISVAD